MSQILNNDDIEQISIQSIINPKIEITNNGLSEELKEELSKDMSNDFMIQLIKLQIDGVWRTYSNDPTILAGVDSNGRAVYKTEWNGEDWLYIHFDGKRNSNKASGELTTGSLEIANYSEEINSAIERTEVGIPMKRYIVSKKTWECAFADEYQYLTSFSNDGIMITATSTPAGVLDEPLPSLTFSLINFKR